MRHGPQGNCQACKLNLLDSDPDDAEFCGRLECLGRRQLGNPKLTQLRQAKEATWLAMTQSRTGPLLERARSEINTGDDMVTGLAPFIDNPLTPLPKLRRDDFETHLRAAIAESFAEQEDELSAPDNDPDFGQRIANEQPEPAVLNAACIACQGDCCLPGAKSRAFISARTINYFRWQHPEMTPDEIADVYLAFLPDQSVENSCVYHGENGCTLPRTYKDDTCNRYLCWFRRKLAKDCAKAPGKGTIVAGIPRNHLRDPSGDGQPVRVVAVSKNGDVEVLSHLKLPALPDHQYREFKNAEAAIHKDDPKTGRT